MNKTHNPTVMNPEAQLAAEKRLADSSVLLKTGIAAFVKANAPDVNPVIQDLMCDSLAEYVMLSVCKFNAGQKEHGGDIRDRDLNHELRMEHIDSFWYNAAKEWPSHVR